MRTVLVAVAATAAVSLGMSGTAQAAGGTVDTLGGFGSHLAGSVTVSDPDISKPYFLEACSFTDWNVPIQAAIYTMKVSATGTYGFTSSMTPAGDPFIGVFDPTYSEANCVQTGRTTMSVDLTAGTPYSFVVWLCPDAECITDFTGGFTVDATGPGAVTWSGRPGLGEATIPIPPWVQSYGRGTSSDPCLDGWNPSWEEWMNNGKGGWVCTREIPSLGE